MTKPAWREVQVVNVPAKPAGLWNLVLPYVAGPRLLRLTTRDKDEKNQAVPTAWRTSDGEECGPEGIPKNTAKPGVLCATAPTGALIAKLGGSTADQPDPGAGGPYPGRKVFAVGSYAVVALANNDSGPLFLTMNDDPESFAKHAGALTVLIEEAPL